MLTQPLLEKLSQLKLSAFRTAFEDQLQNPRYAELSFEERLGLLVDIEITRRPTTTCTAASTRPVSSPGHHRRPRPVYGAAPRTTRFSNSPREIGSAVI